MHAGWIVCVIFGAGSAPGDGAATPESCPLPLPLFNRTALSLPLFAPVPVAVALMARANINVPLVNRGTLTVPAYKRNPIAISLIECRNEV